MDYEKFKEQFTRDVMSNISESNLISIIKFAASKVLSKLLHNVIIKHPGLASY